MNGLSDLGTGGKQVDEADEIFEMIFAELHRQNLLPIITRLVEHVRQLTVVLPTQTEITTSADAQSMRHASCCMPASKCKTRHFFIRHCTSLVEFTITENYNPDLVQHAGSQDSNPILPGAAAPAGRIRVIEAFVQADNQSIKTPIDIMCQLQLFVALMLQA